MISINESSVLTSNNFGLNSFLIDEKELFSPFKKSIINFENCDNQEITNDANFLLTHNLFTANTKQNGKTLHITKSQTKPIFVSLNEKEKAFFKLKVECDENVQAKLILRTNCDSLVKSELFFEMQKGSNLDVIVFCEGEGKNFCNIETKQAEKAQISFVVLDFCESISLYNIFSQNTKPKASFNLNMLYAKTMAQKIDINVLAENYGKESITKINVLGLLDGLAEKSFKGIIDFKRGAKKSVGEEKEFSLLLSQGTKSKSLPVLMCGEEDVTGSHATSSGKLMDDSIFYITTRGIDLGTAKKLLVKAKFNVVLNKIFDKNLFEEVSKKIDRSIDCGK